MAKLSLNITKATDTVYLERLGLHKPPRQYVFQPRFTF